MELIFTDSDLRAMNNHMGPNVEDDEADFVNLSRKLYSLDLNSLGDVHTKAIELGLTNLSQTIQAYVDRLPT